MAHYKREQQKSKTQKKEVLNRFYNDLFMDKVRFKLSVQESSDIRAAVITMVKKIAYKAGHIEENYRVREVILVGSAREGTQISLPDEYDFLLVLDALSQPALIEINKVCLGKENGVHIKLNDNRLKRRFSGLLKDDELICTRDDSIFSMKNGLRETFRRCMTAAMDACVNEELAFTTGVLRVDDTSVKLHGPAFNPQFEWRRKNGEIIEISVDLCPVIRLEGEFPQLLKIENVACEIYYKYARKMNTIIILPSKKGQSCQGGLCFSLIFTETELELMKDISEHHRKCYRILKYLLNAKRRPSMGKTLNDFVDTLMEPETAFFSYILKILVLNHHYIQKCTETQCLASCLERILHKIINIAYIARMPLPFAPPRNWLSNPFFKKQNIWNSRSLKLADQDLLLKLRFLFDGTGCYQ